MPEQWIVLVPHAEVVERGEGWLAGLSELGRDLYWSASEEVGLSSGAGERLPFTITAWRQWLACSDARLRVVVLLAAPECVAFAREASAAGARVIYDKPVPILFSRTARAFHPDDEKALVRVAHDLVAADRATTRLLADTSERLRLIHDFAKAEEAGRHLPAFLEKPSLTVVVDAAADRSRLEATIDSLREARGLAAYDLSVVLDPAEGAGFAELLARETAGDISLVRDPRGPSVSGLAMAVRASLSEVLVFMKSGQLPAGTDWLALALDRMQSDRQIGALGLVSGASTQEHGFRADFAGLMIRRPVFLGVGGVDERLSENASAADFSMRLLSRGYRLEHLAKPVLSGRRQRNPLSTAEVRQLRAQWRDQRTLLGKVLEKWDV